MRPPSRHCCRRCPSLPSPLTADDSRFFFLYSAFRRLCCRETTGAIKERELKAYFGRKVAIDASMSLYQFLVGRSACALACALAYTHTYIRARPSSWVLRRQRADTPRPNSCAGAADACFRATDCGAQRTRWAAADERGRRRHQVRCNSAVACSHRPASPSLALWYLFRLWSVRGRPRQRRRLRKRQRRRPRQRQR